MGFTIFVSNYMELIAHKKLESELVCTLHRHYISFLKLCLDVNRADSSQNWTVFVFVISLKEN